MGFFNKKKVKKTRKKVGSVFDSLKSTARQELFPTKDEIKRKTEMIRAKTQLARAQRDLRKAKDSSFGGAQFLVGGSGIGMGVVNPRSSSVTRRKKKGKKKSKSITINLR